MSKLCIRGFILSVLLLWSCVVSGVPTDNSYRTKISPFSVKIDDTNYYGNRDASAITVYVSEEEPLGAVQIIDNDEVRYTLDFSDGAPHSVFILEGGRQREYVIEIIPSPPLADGFRLIFHEGQLTTTANAHEIRQRLNGKYRLMNPIMLTAAFEPIGDGNASFTGIFDGNDKSISNLKILEKEGNLSPPNYVGFFTAIGDSGEVHNLTLVLAEGDARTPSIEGGSYVGALAGTSLANTRIEGVRALGGFIEGLSNVGGLVGYNIGTIAESYAEGEVSSGSGNAGGLVGNNTGTIKDSSAAGDVTGEGYVGGLVGFATVDGSGSSLITGSHATGTVTGTGDNVGGLVGSNLGTIENATSNGSYATGNVEGQNNVGGLVGNNIGTIEDSSATGDVTGEGYVGGLVGFAAVDGSRSSLITGSHATGNVTGKQNVGGLVGVNENSITNSRAEGDSHAEGVSANIGDPLVSNVGGLVGYARSSSEITGSHATGSVEGKDNVGGLVGYMGSDSSTPTNASSIEDSYAEGAVKGENYVGGLVGLNYLNSLTDPDADLSIKGSYATGSVEGEEHIGGLVGENWAVIDANYATGNVIGEGDSVGGLVGYAHPSTGSVTNSHATGSVEGKNKVGGLVGYADLNTGSIINSHATGSVEGGERVGGLVGEFVGAAMHGSSASIIEKTYAVGAVSGDSDVGGLVGYAGGSSRITKSYAEGAVIGTGAQVGGLVGHIDSVGVSVFEAITDSYATGSVEGESRVGGLVGYAQIIISKTYAVGAVSGNSAVGGLVGYLYNGSINASYFDVELTGQSSGAPNLSSTDQATPYYTIDNTVRIGNDASSQAIIQDNFLGDPNDLTDDWDFVHIWDLQEDGQWPLLR